ncbi:Cinnamyl-alcohol dehydrogenase-like protein [Pseudomonas caricapapayae]|uniref:Cinnamyl-alcohol dehydrogenase-like protein n=1 Tax=Pseudomonas caricapapayae TaxID=46678 RepID=A0A3M6FG75_9PSED|nr:NAD-dependent epimerase/dehydratase family protein [Pseudomonas caricapapayae]RMV79599.1 Cinnamyl-alcohol dehydrogenase-like protein [Pseudomonas caricapapayae]
MTDRVLVTGGGGFVACHLIQQLLVSGMTVNTTVRNLAHTAKVLPLFALQKQYPGHLNLFEADLLVDGAFDTPMRDCTTVHHVASPFLLPEKIKDGRREMLEPALRGTRNVLSSVDKTPSVSRVVMTSTVGAIFGDYSDVLHMKNKTLTEDYFNTSSTLETNPYHYAKVEAEKEAWRICEAQSRWSLVTINPGMILGPSLTPASDSGSLFLLDEMFRGYFFYGMPDLSLTTVDVRDVAAAHIIAANKPDAHGRYILAEKRMISFVEIASIVRRLHRRPWLLPRYQIPDAIVRLIGPFFGLTQDYLSKHLGIRFTVDNQRSVDDLGIRYRSIAQTLTDHYHCWDKQRQRKGQATEYPRY